MTNLKHVTFEKNASTYTGKKHVNWDSHIVSSQVTQSSFFEEEYVLRDFDFLKDEALCGCIEFEKGSFHDCMEIFDVKKNVKF